MSETKLLSPERVEEITERVGGATVGPWAHPSQRQPWVDEASSPSELMAADGSRVLSRNWKEVCVNYEFMSHARRDIPDLLTERELLVGIVRKMARFVEDSAWRERPGKDRCCVLCGAWEEAKRRWDAGERDVRGKRCGTSEENGNILHVTQTSWGIGINTVEIDDGDDDEEDDRG